MTSLTWWPRFAVSPCQHLNTNAMNLIGQKGSNNYINALKDVVGATFAEAEDYAGWFSSRYSYQSENSENYPFEQTHIVRNDVADIGTISDQPSFGNPIPLQVEFLWGRIYHNLGNTVGTPATYTIDGDEFLLTDETKYKLEAGVYLFPEGTEIDCQGNPTAQADLLALTDLRKFALIYLPDNIESPSSYTYRVAVPFDGYYYYGTLRTSAGDQDSGFLYENWMIKPDASIKTQYLQTTTGTTVYHTFEQGLLFTHIVGNGTMLAAVTNYYFEGKRLRIPMSVIGLDHTPTPIEFINIPT